MSTICAFLLSATLLVAGCQAEPAPVEAGVETVRLGGAVFVAQELEVGASPAAVATADLDGDGHLDLMVADAQGLGLFRGDGRGGLVRLGHVPAGENPVDLAPADLDGNGTIDVAVANHETHYLTILLGDGKGAFQAAANSPLRIEVSPHPHAIRARDLNGDGIVDLVVDHRAAHALLILEGKGGGAFESPGILVEVGGDPYRGMAIGDLDGDGRLDLVTPNPTEVGVRLGTVPGQLAFTPAPSLPAAAPFAVELADLNGDGKLDVVAASDEGSSLVEVFSGDGHGRFQPAAGSPFQARPGGKKIARGDFDGDGVEDVAVTSFQSPDVLVLLGGAGSLRTAYLAGGENPWGLAAADLNEDGKDDLVIVDYAHPRATVYLSRGE